MRSFEGKVAAITGAASGMGRELAIELAKQHCHLAISDVNDAGLEETARLVRAFGVNVTLSHVDVAQRDAVFDWAEQVVQAHGRVHLIFNNAGVALSSLLETVSEADFQWIVGINFWGVVHGTQAFLPHLVKSGEGHIINTSSIFGLMAVPTMGPYCVTKFAVRGFTETLRMELELAGSCVSATSVHPGGIRTHIAQSARVDNSLTTLGMSDLEAARTQFDTLLNTTSANSAARQILRAVQRNQRRALIGPDARFMDKVLRFLASWYQPLVVRAARLFRK